MTRAPSYEDERNEFALESLRVAEPMLWNFARKYDTDFDELYQAAAEEVLGAYARAIRADAPRAYMHKVIRYACLGYLGLKPVKSRKQTLSDHYQIVSLNKPLSADSEVTLEDMITEIDQISNECPEEVYAAIKSLPEKYFVVICMKFGLFEYPPHSEREIARSLRVPPSTVHDHIWKAVDLLRERISLLLDSVV
jgi:RNA polymerase sigma factor (sigma-70 family)